MKAVSYFVAGRFVRFCPRIQSSLVQQTWQKNMARIVSTRVEVGTAAEMLLLTATRERALCTPVLVTSLPLQCSKGLSLLLLYRTTVTIGPFLRAAFLLISHAHLLLSPSQRPKIITSRSVSSETALLLLCALLVLLRGRALARSTSRPAAHTSRVRRRTRVLAWLDCLRIRWHLVGSAAAAAATAVAGLWEPKTSGGRESAGLDAECGDSAGDGAACEHGGGGDNGVVLLGDYFVFCSGLGVFVFWEDCVCGLLRLVCVVVGFKSLGMSGFRVVGLLSY